MSFPISIVFLASFALYVDAFKLDTAFKDNFKEIFKREAENGGSSVSPDYEDIRHDNQSDFQGILDSSKYCSDCACNLEYHCGDTSAPWRVRGFPASPTMMGCLNNPDVCPNITQLGTLCQVK